MIKIDLPSVKQTENSKSHTYPLQIAMQTLEFTQATLLYIMMLDYMSEKYLIQDKNLDKLREDMISLGIKEKAWDDSFSYLAKYKEVFKRYVYQNVLIQIRSHWDWYIGHLALFVLYAREYTSNTSSVKEKELISIGYKSIEKQIEILEEACDVSFNIYQNTIEQLKEMSWVRNLGIHNRWEVDEKYFKKTKSANWKIGQIRVFDNREIMTWHQSLVTVINLTWPEIGKRFKKVPAYNHINYKSVR
jgi:hypothetical protein